MFYEFILKDAEKWYESGYCTVKPLIDYIFRVGNLREAQTKALLVYLYLKIKGNNKPLTQLFNEGFFLRGENLSVLNIDRQARDFFENNPTARALFELSRTPLNNNQTGKKTQKTLFPELEWFLIQNPDALDYEAFSKSLFYGVEYPDYLFSLPMGAGKTFLMAAIIYLDLYFAVNEPDNPVFAHNFLIMVPSGLKSSIIPSLKTIERFDPAWILPEPAASRIKRLIKFEVLDQPKTAKKSNKARNPNAQKISLYQPFDTLMGLVLVVNAEKVILDRLDLDKNGFLFEPNEDDKDRAANELRNIIGKIPRMQIHIDEVHHAATDDIKLRQVVNKWHKTGSINSVLGFSGTPYLGKAEAIKNTGNIQLKFTKITNTVFYYPLTEAVRQFLKKPRVEQAGKLSSIDIIEKGVSDFFKTYGDTVYENGCSAKCAVYCGSIERLEEQIYPHLISKMRIKPEEILKFHKGNKRYKISKEAEMEFNSLDTVISKKRIVLLVQVGKEGWDCRSLTSVILSQKGDCPTNMVLQTSCRCLRQVDKGKRETALIWLNEDNARTLDKQLKEEQHTSILEINNLMPPGDVNTIPRFSRMEYLRLPKVDFYQLGVEYEAVVTEADPIPAEKLSAFEPHVYKITASITERGLSPDDPKRKEFLHFIKGENADFSIWVYTIAKESFGSILKQDLLVYEENLRSIFNEITEERNGIRYYNKNFPQTEIRSRIRLAFHQHRELKTKSEIIPQSADLLVIEKLLPVEFHDNLYPEKSEVQTILDADQTGKSIEWLNEELEIGQKKLLAFLESQEVPIFLKEQYKKMTQEAQTPKKVTSAIANKDTTFHYLPYDFSRSRFELNFLKEVLELRCFHDKGLDIYYNGERHLTEFRISCFAKKYNQWRRVGFYTPDFLVIKRKDNRIHKVMIVETKGSGFSEQDQFKKRRSFMETEFLKMNNDKFGYKRFEFVYLPDDRKMDENLADFQNRIDLFFEENR